MNTLNIVASTNESTVVTEYIPETSRSDAYQSEAQLEQEFIRLLTMQGYEYIALNSDCLLYTSEKQHECKAACPDWHARCIGSDTDDVSLSHSVYAALSKL